MLDSMYTETQHSFGMCPFFCIGIVMNCHNEGKQRDFKEMLKDINKYKLKQYDVKVEYLHWVQDRGRDNSPPSQDFILIRHPKKK